jgi:hypothetical protein
VISPTSFAGAFRKLETFLASRAEAVPDKSLPMPGRDCPEAVFGTKVGASWATWILIAGHCEFIIPRRSIMQIYMRITQVEVSVIRRGGTAIARSGEWHASATAWIAASQAALVAQ